MISRITLLSINSKREEMVKFVRFEYLGSWDGYYAGVTEIEIYNEFGLNACRLPGTKISVSSVYSQNYLASFVIDGVHQGTSGQLGTYWANKSDTFHRPHPNGQCWLMIEFEQPISITRIRQKQPWRERGSSVRILTGEDVNNLTVLENNVHLPNLEMWVELYQS